MRVQPYETAGVESALTGGDGKVLTDPPTLATSGAVFPCGSNEPAAASAAAGLDASMR